MWQISGLRRAGVRKRRPPLLVAVIAVIGLMTAACAADSTGDAARDGPDQAGADGAATVAELSARVPSDIRERGVLRVVTDASYPPLEAFAEDGRSIVGVDPDIADAIGAVLGLEVSLTNADFGDLIPVTTAGDADLIMSAMTDTLDREEFVDFVNYFSAGTSIVVQRGNPQLITDLPSLCGHTVAVEDGTTQLTLISRYQARCAQPMTVLPGQTNDDALLRLRTGRAAAVLMDFPSAEYLTTEPATHGRYELASTNQYEPGLYGIGVAKDRPELRDLVADALQSLVDSGVYLDILSTWNVAGSAVTTISINAAGGNR